MSNASVLEDNFKKIRLQSKRSRGEGINLSFKCNNNCIFCYDQLRRKQIKDKTLEQVKSEVLQLKNNEVNIISLRGSEPTIYPQILELIRFIKSQDLKFRLTSNARFFYYEEMAKTFAENGLVNVYTSLHSDKAEIHDELTRAVGSFKQTVGGIKNLLKHGVEVETNTTILKQNCKDLKKVAEFISEEFNKIARARFSFLYHQGTEGDINFWRTLVPSISEVRNEVTEAMGVFRKHGIYSFIEKLPVCGAPKYYKDFKPEDYVIRVNTKPPICASCKYFRDNYCIGVNEVYLKLYGEKDLKPQ